VHDENEGIVILDFLHRVLSCEGIFDDRVAIQSPLRQAAPAVVFGIPRLGERFWAFEVDAGAGL